MTVAELKEFLAKPTINDEDIVTMIGSNDENPYTDGYIVDKVLHITSSNSDETGLICFMPD